MTANRISLAESGSGTGAGSGPNGVPLSSPTHPCMRCGAPVSEAGAALCDDCNPLGLAQPSATQVHGIAFAGIALAVILMAVVGRLSVAGVGPFDAQVASVAAAGEGLAVTLTITNDGSSAGATTCTVNDPSARYGGASAFIQSPRIAPGQTVTVTETVGQLGSSPRPLEVSCSKP